MQLKQTRRSSGLATEDTEPHSAAEALGAVDRPRPGSEVTRLGAERRARTTAVAFLTAAPNGTSRRVPPAGPPVTSNAIFGRRW